MKINKTTTTYITSLIEAKAKPKMDAIDKRLEAAQAKASEVLDALAADMAKIKAEAEAKAKAAMKKRGVSFHKGWSGQTYEPEVEFSHDSGETKFHAEIEKVEDEKRELKKRIEEKRVEIIAKLTLGGTVADLERLIAELRF